MASSTPIILKTIELKSKLGQGASDIVDYGEHGIDISGFQNRVISISFSFDKASQIQFHTRPELRIDNVRLSRIPMSSNSHKGQQSIQQLSFSAESTTNEITVTEPNYPIGITNSEFNTLKDWQYEGAFLEVDEGILSIRPVEKKKPAVLRHPVFTVPPEATSLQVFFSKDNLRKADVMLILKDLSTGASTTVYEEHLRINALDILGDQLNKVNQTIDGANLRAYNKSFESIMVDIQEFRTKPLELELVYIPVGKGRPKLFVDYIRILDR